MFLCTAFRFRFGPHQSGLEFRKPSEYQSSFPGCEYRAVKKKEALHLQRTGVVNLTLLSLNRDPGQIYPEYQAWRRQNRGSSVFTEIGCLFQTSTSQYFCSVKPRSWTSVWQDFANETRQGKGSILEQLWSAGGTIQSELRFLRLTLSTNFESCELWARLWALKWFVLDLESFKKIVHTCCVDNRQIFT